MWNHTSDKGHSVSLTGKCLNDGRTKLAGKEALDKGQEHRQGLALEVSLPAPGATREPRALVSLQCEGSGEFMLCL